MKINHKILSIPPHISTSWEHVISMHVVDEKLVITLDNNTKAIIPNLQLPVLEAVFQAHQEHLEAKTTPTPEPSETVTQPNTMQFGIPLDIQNLGQLGGFLEHNQAQANHPPLPKEMLEKITSFTQMMGEFDSDLLPKPEPHCNCLHCQIARAIGGEEETEIEEEAEELVTDDELTFREWDIAQVGDKLYTVKNPLDDKEEYQVFLGDPVGCTCGKKDCNHIVAVLKS